MVQRRGRTVHSSRQQILKILNPRTSFYLISVVTWATLCQRKYSVMPLRGSDAVKRAFGTNKIRKRTPVNARTNQLVVITENGLVPPTVKR